MSLLCTFLTCVRLRSRPKSVSEVAHQEEVVQTLQRALETANVRGPARSSTLLTSASLCTHCLQFACTLEQPVVTCAVQGLDAGSIRQGLASCSEPREAGKAAQRCPRKPTKARRGLIVRPCPLTCVLLWGAAAAPALLWPARHRQDVHRARDSAAAVRVRSLLHNTCTALFHFRSVVLNTNASGVEQQAVCRV